jgi:Zn-finger nucleic acid-binding protein
MLALEAGGIEVDHCAGCGGTWLDAGELELLTRGDVASAEAPWRDAPDAPERRKRCPICSRRMAHALYEGRPPRLDRCARGHGWWFDRDELKTLLADRAEGGPAASALRAIFGQQGEAT